MNTAIRTMVSFFYVPFLNETTRNCPAKYLHRRHSPDHSSHRQSKYVTVRSRGGFWTADRRRG